MTLTELPFAQNDLESRETPPISINPPNGGLVDQRELQTRLLNLRTQYRNAEPFPHVLIEDFLPRSTAEMALAEFPAPNETAWIQYRHYNENTLGSNDRRLIPPGINRLIDDLSRPEFIRWLEELTGIDGLFPDPSLDGGGLHQTESGGFIRMHVDFSHHHRVRSWKRRCNLIIYLNPIWEETWGGSLELWDAELSQCKAKYPPLLNHALIFTTSESSFHGYPDALQLPNGVTRKSIALYYYTEDRTSRGLPRATKYSARPGDGLRQILIRADNAAVAIYSLLKSYFGGSDLLVGRVLRRIFRGPR